MRPDSLSPPVGDNEREVDDKEGDGSDKFNEDDVIWARGVIYPSGLQSWVCVR